MKNTGSEFTSSSIRTTIHIEELDTMNIISLINALKKFEIRRGTPNIMVSDNGSNCIGVERELMHCIHLWNEETIAEHMTYEEIRWVLNPVSVSHMGGFCKRQIKTVGNLMTNR